jgi:hypothetical protein
MAAKFTSVWPYWGVDDQANPNPWMMAPQNRHNHVLLRDGAGLTVRVARGAVTVHEVTSTSSGPPNPFTYAAKNVALQKHARLFMVGSATLGNATLEAVDSAGTVKAKLDCSVKKHKVVLGAFNFVRDNASHRTKYNPPDADRWIEIINRIFLYQANVWLRKVDSRWTPINRNLGDVVRFVSQRLTRDHGVPRAEHEWDLVVAKGHPSAAWNVFMVWEYEQDITPAIDNANAGTLGGNTICEDNMRAEPAESMAHEFGHFLGLNHPAGGGTGNWLMSDASRTGNKIPKDHVNIANP